jgi:hypothetical protein
VFGMGTSVSSLEKSPERGRAAGGPASAAWSKKGSGQAASAGAFDGPIGPGASTHTHRKLGVRKKSNVKSSRESKWSSIRPLVLVS